MSKKKTLDFMDDMGYTDRNGDIQFWKGQKSIPVFTTA